MASQEFGLLRGVFRERVDGYKIEVARRGRAEARDALLADMEQLVRDDPAIAVRLLAGAIDLYADA